jgi:excisionase family DNA binding protein
MTAQRFAGPKRSSHQIEADALLQVPIREAARLLNYHERTIHRLIERGELHAVGRGKLRRIPLSSIRDYQQRNWC